MFSTRTVDVAVAVHLRPLEAVAGPKFAVLYNFNLKWGGYTLPMKKIGDQYPPHMALAAFREVIGETAIGAEAKPLLYRELERVSGRNGRKTLYRYHGYEVILNDATKPAPPAGAGMQRIYLPLGSEAAADLVTWSAKELVSELIAQQEVAIAVVMRGQGSQREYLMVYHEGYNGLFPPASRIRDEATPMLQARLAIQHDTGYRGLSVAGAPTEIRYSQTSSRYGLVRDYRFFLTAVHFPKLDLAEPGNAFEASLRTSCSRDWRWVSDAELDQPEQAKLSPTIEAIREAMRKLHN